MTILSQQTQKGNVSLTAVNCYIESNKRKLDNEEVQEGEAEGYTNSRSAKRSRITVSEKGKPIKKRGRESPAAENKEASPDNGREAKRRRLAYVCVCVFEYSLLQGTSASFWPKNCCRM
jgi:hypothetical protein